MGTAQFDVNAVRRRFTSLQAQPPFAFFDAPGGSQVPDEVGAAVARAFSEASANLGAPYATSRRVGAITEEAETRAARFLGCAPGEVTFGPNMTSLNFALTRTVSRDWKPGDEILSSRLDHDGNVAPWLAVAEDRGFVVKYIDVNDDTTLNLEDLQRKITDRTRVVAFSWASNAVGTVVDARRVCEIAHQAGALAWIDAVHYAAHRRIDVRAVDADVLLCSAYKWCGPHLGLAYVREAVGANWRAYKARPASTSPAGRRFATGTLPYELLAGVNATFRYLDDIGGFGQIEPYETALASHLMSNLPASATLYGLPTMAGRVPTFLITLDGVDSDAAVTQLADAGFGVWADRNWYSLGLYESLGYQAKAIRIGLAHYNTVDEVDRLLEQLDVTVRAAS